jgi:hypothetical protein
MTGLVNTEYRKANVKNRCHMFFHLLGTFGNKN